jgi:hypothetical protein
MCDSKHCDKDDKVISFSAKCSDLFSARREAAKYHGYVLDFGLGSDCGDYVEGSLCVACGKIQGRFPRAIPKELK